MVAVCDRREATRCGAGAAGCDGDRPNRRSHQAAQSALLSKHARRQDRSATESDESFALGLIDLDGFKPINDAHGHPVGDQILQQVAVRLAQAMNGRGSAARIGGDEFAVLCIGIGSRDEAIALGEEIQAIFATRLTVRRSALV